MTTEQLEALKLAARDMATISELLNDTDDESPRSILALLTAQTGCLTALTHIADMLKTLTERDVAHKTTKREYLQ